MESLFRKVEDMCATAGCDCYIASSYRSSEKQWELYRRGRELRNGVWVKVGVVVTNATPDKTPHCAELDGKPAALAVDIALAENGKWLGDWDVRWSILPTAVALTDREKLTSGAFFRKLRDYPHVEYKDWKRIWPAK